MLEQIILKTLKKADDILETIRETEKLPFENNSLLIPKGENRDHTTIPVKEYLPLVEQLKEKIEAYSDVLVKRNGELIEDTNEINKWNKRISKSIIIPSKNALTEFYKIKDVTNKKSENISEGLSKLYEVKQYAKELGKYLNIIGELKNKNIYLENEEVEDVLLQMINPKINISRARKIILKKPEKTIEKVVEKVKQIVVSESKKQAYIPKIYDAEEIIFLEMRGITGRTAKDWIDNSSYKQMKENIMRIEEIFEEREINKCEAYKIYQKHPKVLQLKNSEFIEYHSALEDVLDTFPNATGILPNRNIKNYKSQRRLRKLIRQDKPKVYINNLIEITNRKDRDVLEKELLEGPFNTGRRIVKKSKIINASFYETCKKERGHDGHFRREGFGPRRAIFEVSRNADDTLTIDIFKYFKTHQEYEAYYRH
ncbi:hypothetical protein H8D83_02140 [Candidatus Woesearchaeota archaeon]|nr:hypothetical protein [Candidatus Woesearchaeota archaeon]MBL7051248.1 hypothetical protein [Candidatus Woesearchaeota archaeon]